MIHWHFCPTCKKPWLCAANCELFERWWADKINEKECTVCRRVAEGGRDIRETEGEHHAA